jgi:hypothetical protein
MATAPGHRCRGRRSVHGRSMWAHWVIGRHTHLVISRGEPASRGLASRESCGGSVGGPELRGIRRPRIGGRGAHAPARGRPPPRHRPAARAARRPAAAGAAPAARPGAGRPAPRAFAHEHDVIHRDVSPGNVLIRRSDGAATLTDFGLACKAGEKAANYGGDVAGTYGYIAPEVLRGETVTALSDLYSRAPRPTGRRSKSRGRTSVGAVRARAPRRSSRARAP